jgi:hypothetical protein
MTGGDDPAAIATATRLETGRRLTRQDVMIDRTIAGRLDGRPELAILLDLCLASHERRQVYLWQACIVAGLPLSTTHRRIAKLADDGYLVRTGIRADRRRVGLEATPAAIALIERLLDRLARL